MNRAIRTACVGLAMSLLAAGCSESNSVRDGGTGDINITAACPHGVDTSVDPDTAIDLAEGSEVDGYICPRNDKDFYKITLPQGKKLLRVKLLHTVAVSNVQLTYQIFTAGKTLASQAPPWTGSGIRSFDDYHCLEPGTYYIAVQDEGNDAKDGNNPYKLSFESVADPDTGEPNDDPAKAGAPGGGYISCTGDVDYFKVSVPSTGKLLDVTLENTEATPVDLKYTVYDKDNKIVAQQAVPDGSKGPTKLHFIHAAPQAGDYFVAVEDSDSDDSDPQRSYTLGVQVIDEPDPNEKGTRNDLSKDATSLGSYDCSTGKTFTKTGRIASQADVDYYKIDMGDCAVMPVVEVVIDYKGASEVDPQFALVYPHAGTSCTSDKCCQVVDVTCKDFLDCLRISPQCVPKGDSYCNDKACEESPGLGCSTEKRCQGAVTCLPEGKCGVEQVVRSDEDGSDGALVRTAQPLLHGGPWYVRVGDLKSDDYEYDKTYTLTVRIRPDPDGGRELNSEYFSETVFKSLGVDTGKLHAKAAKDNPTKIQLGQAMSGHLSYEGDQDWYIFDWPCTTGECVAKATFGYTGSNCPSASNYNGLEFRFAVHYDDSDTKDAFPKSPTTGQGGSFGPPERCFLFRSKGSYLISVTDMDHNMWSWDCGYTLTISKVGEGCLAPCKTYNGKCYVP